MPPSIPLPQLLLLFVVAIVIYGVSQLRPK
jgi:Sec-independent protein translocase protein TatA